MDLLARFIFKILHDDHGIPADALKELQILVCSRKYKNLSVQYMLSRIDGCEGRVYLDEGVLLEVYWDLDEEHKKLGVEVAPSTVYIDLGTYEDLIKDDNETAVSDYLSDTYGYSVEGWTRII